MGLIAALKGAPEVLAGEVWVVEVMKAPLLRLAAELDAYSV